MFSKKEKKYNLSCTFIPLQPYCWRSFSSQW